VTDPGLPEPDPEDRNPLSGMPIFGDLMRLLGQRGPMSWDAAGQLALSIAAEGGTEANVDPVERMRYEELGRIAEMHVADLSGLQVGTARVVPVTRTAWAQRALAEYRPFFDRLSRSLGRGAQAGPPDAASAGDPFGAMLGQMLQMVAPMMLGMTVGSMVGHLSRRAFGTYHLPLPRPAGAELQVVVPNVARFAEDWSIAADDIRLWVSLSELSHHAVLSLPHVSERLSSLVGEYIDGFQPDAGALEERLGRLDVEHLGDPAALQKLFADPEIVLGAVRSPAQDGLRPRLDALVAVVVGWVDHVMDRAAGRLLGGDEGRLAEAVRRDRVEASDADRFVEKLLGLELGQPAYERGSAFVEGVVERAGEAGLDRLWEGEARLPTPAEVDAPGLWLARIELED
jgi:putative hydrolase